MTKEDHDTPSNAELIAEDPDDPYEEHGQSFNWEIIPSSEYFLTNKCALFTRLVLFSACSGLILPNGDINWNCPCLGGMASGPCGSQFKEAFSCFHYSKEEVKGSECIDQFRNMQECMQRYPELYPQEEEKDNPTPAATDSASTAASTSPDSALSSESDSASLVSRPEAAAPSDSTQLKDNSTAS